MDLVVKVYENSRIWPKEEIYGLTSQARRAAVSVPSNIAEGSSKRTTGEYLQSLGHAKGSLAELETQTILASRLGFQSESKSVEILTACDEIGRMLSGLVKSLSSKG